MSLLNQIFNRNRILLISCILIMHTITWGQGVGINDDNSNPDPSAILDVKSTTKGLLIPRMTSTERVTIATPAIGLMVFDNTTLSFWYYDGTQWNEIDGAIAESVFDTAGGIVIPNTNLVDETSSDFVFGSTQLDDDGNGDHEARFFFDKSKKAFRAGHTNGTEWDEANIGDYSTAFGSSTKATGDYSTAFGRYTEATGDYSTAFGRFTDATGEYSMAFGSSTEAAGGYSTAFGSFTEGSGDYSTAFGRFTDATGDYSTAFGYFTDATGKYSTAFGTQAYANGDYSMAWGRHTEAASYGETSLGVYTTSYTPNSTTSWDASDRLFVIGNGASSFDRSNALVLLKNGNLGLGTSIPDFPLDVPTTGANARIGVSEIGAWPVNSDYAYFGHEDLDHSLDGNYALLQSISGRTFLNAASGSDIRFRINNTDHMILDLNGNLGLGTSVPDFPLDVPDAEANARIGVSEIGAWPANSGYAYFGHEDLDHTVIGNYALLQNNSGRTFLNAASGSDIRFGIDHATHMILASNGNVGIGTNGPNFPLDVQSAGANARIGVAEMGAWPHNSNFAYFGHEDLNHASSNNYALLQNSSGRTFLNATSGWDIRFRINNTDHMILDPNGNVGIGTTSPNSKLTVASTGTDYQSGIQLNNGGSDNWYIYQDANDGLNFQDDGAHRLHIADDGDVGIGTTSPNSKLTVASTGTDYQSGIQLNNGSSEDWYMYQNSSLGVTFRDDGADRFYIKANGDIQVGTNGDGTKGRANSWNTFSDRRWKKNFELIPDALTKLDQINGYFYDWKDQSKDSSQQVGVIAQEIELVLPQCVSTDEKGYKSVDYSKLTALLIQVNKEQEAKIKALEADKVSMQATINTNAQRLDAVEKSLNQTAKNN